MTRAMVYLHQNPKPKLTIRFHRTTHKLPEQEVADNIWQVQVCTTKDAITITRMAPIDKFQTLTTMDDATFELDWGITHEQHGDPAHLEVAIKAGVAIAVSNGSFQDSNRLAAWTIEGRDQHHCLLGSGWTQGELDNQSAYQSKLFGL